MLEIQNAVFQHTNEHAPPQYTHLLPIKYAQQYSASFHAVISPSLICKLSPASKVFHVTYLCACPELEISVAVSWPFSNPDIQAKIFSALPGMCVL